MNRGLAVLIVWLAVVVHPSEANARWTRMTTEHFVFVGDADEGTIRSIAERLEMFREVIGRVLPGQATSNSLPTVVIVFQNARSLAPFRPVFEGRPVEIGGFFASGDDVSYIAVNAEQESDAYGVIFHEYAHFLTQNAFGEIPLWANEGLAEFYRTFVASGARSAMLGRPPADHLQLLERTTPLPVAQLIAVMRDSPMYNEGSRRGLFYATSWALVHYLTFGGPERSDQWRRFLSFVGQGEAGPEAFAEAFGTDTSRLDRDLRTYLRQAMTGLRVDFDEKIERSAASPGFAISDQDAAGYLGELMAGTGRADEARAYLRQVVDASPRATAALGRLEWRAGNEDLAFSLLEQAVSRDPSLAVAQRSYGRLLARQAVQSGLQEAALGLRARAALDRSLEIEPGNVAATAALAELEMAAAFGALRSVALMQAVVRASPGREDYRLLLAQALLLQGDHAAASSYLGPLVGRGRTPEIREAARQLLTRVAEATNAAGSGRSGRGPDPPVTAPEAAVVPSVRRVQPGEMRVVGVFSAVECLTGAIVLHVDTADGDVKLAVAGLQDVEFLTYRKDTPTSVACGPQRPAYRALATYRTDAPPVAGANTVNRAVAIEWIPDGYEPR